MVRTSNSLVIHNDNLHTGSAKRNGASGVKGVDAAGVLDTPIVMADIAAAIQNAASGLPVLDASTLLALTQQRLNFKIGTFSKDTADVTGNQAIAGVGFTPRLVIFAAAVIANVGEMSIGWSNGTNHYTIYDYFQTTANVWSYSTSKCIVLNQGAAINYAGLITSLDVDGFTIAWTKTGAKTGSANIHYIAVR